DENPLAGIEVRVMPAASRSAVEGTVAKVGTDGTLHLKLDTAGPQKVMFTVNGKTFSTKPFDLRRSGGKMQILAQWPAVGQYQALVDVAAPGQVVYAECTFRNQRYRSLPFQLLADSGTNASIYVFLRAVLQFKLESFVDDEQLFVRGQIEVKNNTW